MRARFAGLAGVSAAAYVALYVLGRSSGSTPAERRAALPGDALVPDAHLVTDHAVTVDAPPDRVWPCWRRWAGTSAATTRLAGSTG